jgi:hypothetical protein
MSFLVNRYFNGMGIDNFNSLMLKVNSFINFEMPREGESSLCKSLLVLLIFKNFTVEMGSVNSIVKIYIVM